jgi:membrane protease YdiL (CAAX protease family)
VELAASLGGALAEAAAWRAVAAGRSPWRVLPPTLGLLGLAGAALRPPRAAGLGAGSAAVVGVALGLALYGATVAFVRLAIRFEPFERHTRAQYARAAEVPLAPALFLAAGVSAVGEELFWRGLVLGRLSEALGPGAAAAVAWAAYVGANLPSGSLPIVAGALVGGATWTLLAAWSGGLLASVLAHCLWTALMLAVPPVRVGAA